MKIRPVQSVTEMEKEPAYIRKQVVLANVASSSESQISRLSLQERDENKTELKQNNPFIHDAVD